MKQTINLLTATERTLRALQQLEIACRPLSAMVSQSLTALKNSTEVLRHVAITSQQVNAKPTPHEAQAQPPETPNEPQPVSEKPWIASNPTVSKPLRRKQQKTLK